jgi:hypothetical protein
MENTVRILTASLPLAALAGAYAVLIGYGLAGDRSLLKLALPYAVFAILASCVLYFLPS